MRTIQASWESFEHDVVPKDATAAQRQNMRLAFFGGAAGALGILFTIADEGTTEDAGVEILEGLRREVYGIADDAKAGHA